MMWCMLYRKRLGAYLDGEMSRRKDAAVERHLKKCPSCTAALEGIRGLDPVLRSVDVPNPPSDMVLRIMSEARTLKAFRSRRDAGESHRSLFLQPAWAFRAATVGVTVVGLVAGSFMGWSTRQGSTGPEYENRGVGMEDGYLIETFGAAPEGSLESGTVALLGGGRQ